MVENFYNVADKIDRLKQVDNPTQREIKEIAQYLVEMEYVRYFFHDLDNPAWIQPLHSIGLLSKVPPPLEDKNQPGYFSMPVWYEGEYLKRMADKFPDIVMDVASSLETDNSRALRTMLESLLKVPVNIAAEVTGKFQAWIETPFSNFMTLSHELGVIMEYLAKGGEANAALATLSILLAPVQVKDRFEEGKLVASTRHDLYWLNQALQQNLPVLTEIDPVGVINVAEEQLIKAVELELDPKYGDDVKKITSYWRLNISPRSEENYENDIKNLLVNTIISALNVACEQKASSVPEILNRYIENEYSIFRRIGLYMLRSWGQQYVDLLEKAYNINQEEPIKGFRSEFERLVELQFRYLPEIAKNETILKRKSPNPERVEELLKHNPERFSGETTEEKRQTIIERWQIEDLAPLASFLEGEDREYYEYLQKKYGKPTPRPESGVVVTSWEGSESPIGVEELSKKSVNEVIHYLLDYSPPKSESFGVPSREGLARTLETDVQNRANDYASNSGLFINGELPFVYHSHLLRGLQNAVKNQEKFQLREVVAVCEFITNQEKDKFQKPEFEEGLPAAKLAVVQLFEEVFRTKEPYIENDPLEKSGQLIVNLLHQEEPFPDNEDAQGYDPATHSLNCIHGVAMHSLVSYGLYCERKRKQEMGDKGEPVMIPIVKETLTEKLDKTKNPSLAIHSIFGWYFPQFIHLDKEWALENRERIFPVEPGMTKHWRAAWSAYIRFSDVYTNVFPELIKQYQKALEEFPSSEKSQGLDRSDEQMATHILKAYLLDMIKLDSEDGLLRLYYQKADDETRSHGNFWLSQVLGSQQPSAEDVIWKKIWNIWQWRIEEAVQSKNRDNHSKEITNFSRLLKHCPLDLEELNSVIEQTLSFKFNGFEAGEIIDYLGKHSENFPSLAISNLQKIVLSSQEFYILEDTKKGIEQILSSAMNADDTSKAKAIEIINIFGERGDYSWRPLLEKRYKYDVFISYNPKNSDLVRNELLPRLEAQGLKVCVDFRDFIAGASALDNMRMAVNESRATILIMTSSYIKNEWITFEEIFVAKKERLVAIILEKSEIPVALRPENILEFSQFERFEIQLNELITVSRNRGK